MTSIRILIGNTSSREIVEQLSEAYKRLDLVQAAEEKERYQTKSTRRQRAEESSSASLQGWRFTQGIRGNTGVSGGSDSS